MPKHNAREQRLEGQEPRRGSNICSYIVSAQTALVRSTQFGDEMDDVTVLPVTIDDIEAARERLRDVLRPTPTRFADAISRAIGRPVAIKPEHLQRAGSFKIRGAYNRIVQLPPGVAVVAASAGNHAQGVALAASLTGRHATIFMPDTVSLPKLQASEDYGATVIFGGPVLDDCLGKAKAFALDTGAVFVPPFDDPDVVAGQGTLGLEIVDEIARLTGPNWPTDVAPVVLIPIGGGGLVAGAAIALRARRPDIAIIGVEAEGAASMRRSLEAGSIVTLDAVSTMADGIALRAPGRIPFEVVMALVDDVVTVTEDAISTAVLLLLERAKAVVEPSGAVGLAALMEYPTLAAGHPAVVVLSGGNVDPLLLSNIAIHGMSAAGRYVRLRIVFNDRPGSLAALTASLARQSLNVLDVEHHRIGLTLGVDEVEVLVTVETRRPAQRDEVIQQLVDEGFRVELVR